MVPVCKTFMFKVFARKTFACNVFVRNAFVRKVFVCKTFVRKMFVRKMFAHKAFAAKWSSYVMNLHIKCLPLQAMDSAHFFRRIFDLPPERLMTELCISY